MPKKEDLLVETLGPIVQMYDRGLEYPENSSCQDAYEEISQRISEFQDTDDLSYGLNAVTRCRTLVQKCIIVMLKFFGESPSQVDHLANQKKLKEFLPGEYLFFAYIDIIRMAGNEYCTVTISKENHESIALLHLVYHILTKFYEIISSNGEKELVIFRSLEIEDNVKRVPLFDKPKMEYRKYQHRDEKFKENQAPISFLTILKESPKSSPRESPREDELPKIVGQEDKGTPCMENACGLDCQFSGCPRTHGRKDLVYFPLTKIGTKVCCRGHKCEKNSKLLTMKNGWVVSICPDLHKDALDEPKAELGRRWKLFSEGKIKYEAIFK